MRKGWLYQRHLVGRWTLAIMWNGRRSHVSVGLRRVHRHQPFIDMDVYLFGLHVLLDNAGR